MSFKVLVSDPISETGIAQLLNAPHIQVDVHTNLSKQALIDTIGQYDGLIVRSQTQVDEGVLQNAIRLKIIARAGVGVDNIDLDAATKAGILVVNAPDGNTISAAEHTVAMMMSLSRKIPDACQTLKNGKWDRKSYKGVELFHKTLGIVGFGRIGVEVAKRAKSFQMTILAHDPFLTDERAKKLGVKKASLEEVYANADFITVHTPLTKETYHLINEQAIASMKSGVRIINCARGGIIDEQALLLPIKEGKIAGVALDVFEEEPPQANPLFDLPEVIVTPHLGASTVEAQEKVARDVSEEMLRFSKDESIHHAVNMPPISDQVREALEPYFHLGEKIGEMVGQLTEGVPVDVELTYSGELMDLNTEPLTRVILKSILNRYLGDHVNPINVIYYVKETGLSYNVIRTPKAHGFTGIVNVSVKSREEKRSVAGTLLNGYGPRIVKIDDYAVDVPTIGHLLCIQQHDLPGLIGHVGSCLGKHHINIGSMQVGRQSIGGDAIMVLNVDKSLSQNELDELKALEHIKRVKRIDL